MKIGIDISQIVYKGTGVARFTEGLVNTILKYDKKNQWFFFFSSFRRNLDPNLEKEINNKGHKLLKWKIPPTLLSFFWNDLHQFSKLLTFNFSLSTSLDWFITSDWTEPPLKINKTTIVHDLVYLRYPETVNQKIKITQEKRLQWVKKESKIVFTDSFTSKQDLIDLLKIESKRIHVIYPGVNVIKPSSVKIAQALKKYHLQKPFILTVGKLEPRKNLKRLIEAFQQFNNLTIELIITGPTGWDNNVQSINRLNNVKFLGLVSDDDLFSLYSSCLFFIYPSIWEGFGYPIVEAMKLGAPVTCSNTSSLKEIAGDSALLFNPQDTNDITKKIKIMIENEQLRKQLIAKGRETSKIFTWENYLLRFLVILTGLRRGRISK